MNQASTVETQIFYARIAGFVYLLLIVLFMSGEFIISGIVGDGEFAATAQSIASSERLYRIALALQILVPVFTVVLGYALYITVRPVNEHLAQMAMFWRLGESFIGAAVMIFGFVKLQIYTGASGAAGFELAQWEALIALARGAHTTGFNFSTLFFSVGSIAFFYLFLKSNYLPKLLSVLGLVASVLVVLTCLGNLVFPEHRDILEFGWAPMFLSEIATGLWLLFRGVKVR